MDLLTLVSDKCVIRLGNSHLPNYVVYTDNMFSFQLYASQMKHLFTNTGKSVLFAQFMQNCKSSSCSSSPCKCFRY